MDPREGRRARYGHPRADPAATGNAVSAPILCLVAALFVLPSPSARRRLRRGVPDAALPPIPRVLVLGVVIVVLVTVAVWVGSTPAVGGAIGAPPAVGG